MEGHAGARAAVLTVTLAQDGHTGPVVGWGGLQNGDRWAGAGLGLRECAPLFLRYTKTIDFSPALSEKEYLISASAAWSRHLVQALAGPWRRCADPRGVAPVSPLLVDGGARGGSSGACSL